MKMQNVEDLLFTGLTYTLDLENQLSKALPKQAEATSDPELKQTFQTGAQASENHAKRLEQVFSKLGKSSDTNTNHVVKAMTEEVENMISNTDQGPVRDAALIVASNQMAHFQIANYGSLQTYAELIGNGEAASLLEQTLNEEKQADEKLTALGTNKINKQAAQSKAIGA